MVPGRLTTIAQTTNIMILSDLLFTGIGKYRRVRLMH